MIVCITSLQKNVQQIEESSYSKQTNKETKKQTRLINQYTTLLASLKRSSKSYRIRTHDMKSKRWLANWVNSILWYAGKLVLCAFTSYIYIWGKCFLSAFLLLVLVYLLFIQSTHPGSLQFWSLTSPINHAKQGKLRHSSFTLHDSLFLIILCHHGRSFKLLWIISL